MTLLFVVVSLIAVINGLNQLFKGRFYKLAIVQLFLLTDGFEIVPSAGGAMTYSNVGIVLMIFSILYLKQKGIIQWRGNNLEKWYFYFGIYLLACAMFSYLHYGFAPFEIFRVLKWSLPFGFFFLTRTLSVSDAKRLLLLLLKITIFLNVCYIIQCFTGKPILNYYIDNVAIGEGGIARFYNKPIFSTFFLLLLLFNNGRLLPNKVKLVSILVLVAALILSLNRIEIFGFIIAYLICLFCGSSKIGKKVQHAAIILLMVIPVMFVMNMRENESYNKVSSFDDVKTVLSGGFRSNQYVSEQSGTFTFRFAMMSERFDYMAKCSVLENIFGLGLGQDDYKKVEQKYNFSIGTFTINHGVSQLSSADFAWIGLICQWGLLGTFLFICVYYNYQRFFFLNRRNTLSIVSFAYLVYLFIWSFAGSTFSQAAYYILPMISYSLIYKKNRLGSLFQSKNK